VANENKKLRAKVEVLKEQVSDAQKERSELERTLKAI
jgi:hypothetical protein